MSAIVDGQDVAPLETEPSATSELTPECLDREIQQSDTKLDLNPSVPAIGDEAFATAAATQEASSFLPSADLDGAYWTHVNPQNVVIDMGPLKLKAPAEFDPTKPPVILIHGAGGAPGDLSEYGQALEKSGHQVLYVDYDDMGVVTHKNANLLAAALMKLRSICTLEGPALTIVGHSMGGIIGIAALNTLANPRWDGHKAGFATEPRAGFSRVHFTSLDSPWDGAPGCGTSFPVVGGLVRVATLIARKPGAWEMRNNSQFYRRLFDTKLEGVDFRTYLADQSMAGSPRTGFLRMLLSGSKHGEAWLARYFVDEITRDVGRMRRFELVQLGSFILRGKWPRGNRAFNRSKSLERDERFAALRARLIQQNVTPKHRRAFAAAVLETLHEVMGYKGDHMSVLDDETVVREVVDAAQPKATPEQ